MPINKALAANNRQQAQRAIWAAGNPFNFAVQGVSQPLVLVGGGAFLREKVNKRQIISYEN